MSTTTSSSIPTFWHMDCISWIHAYQFIENYDKIKQKNSTFFLRKHKKCMTDSQPNIDRIVQQHK
jgi:hypothetical protein